LLFGLRPAPATCESVGPDSPLYGEAFRVSPSTRNTDSVVGCEHFCTEVDWVPDKLDKPESDPRKRDEVLKRMLKMPPKPHKPPAAQRASRKPKVKKN
jgi:hypothetical protein